MEPHDNVLSLIMAPDNVKAILNVDYIKTILIQYYNTVKYVGKSMELISFLNNNKLVQCFRIDIRIRSRVGDSEQGTG